MKEDKLNNWKENQIKENIEEKNNLKNQKETEKVWITRGNFLLKWTYSMIVTKSNTF